MNPPGDCGTTICRNNIREHRNDNTRTFSRSDGLPDGVLKSISEDSIFRCRTPRDEGIIQYLHWECFPRKSEQGYGRVHCLECPKTCWRTLFGSRRHDDEREALESNHLCSKTRRGHLRRGSGFSSHDKDMAPVTVRGYPFFILDFLFDVVDRVRGFHVECNGFSGQCFLAYPAFRSGNRLCLKPCRADEAVIHDQHPCSR
jgi:hypothetical protein